MQETYSPHNLSLKFDLDRATALRVLKDVLPDAERTKGRPTYTIATFARALEAHRLKNASNANDGPIADGISDTASLTAARVRIALANAIAKERHNQIQDGLYTLNEIAVSAFDRMISTQREVILCIAGKTADRIAALRDTTSSQSEHRSAVFEIIDEEARGVLRICASPQTYVDTGTEAAVSQPVRPAAPIPADESPPSTEGQSDVGQL
jgi:hypothetical protein